MSNDRGRQTNKNHESQDYDEQNISHEDHEDHEDHEHHEDHEGHEQHEHHEDHEGHEQHEHHDHHEDHEHHGAHDHHGHADFKTLFLRSLPIGLIIMLLSPMMGITLPFQFTFQYSDLIVTALATLLLIYGGRPFYQGAIDEFKNRAPGMMALVSLGISVSFVYSVYAVISRYVTNEHVMDFFFEFASLILIMLLGHWIEMKTVQQAGDAQESLAELIPKEAEVLRENEFISIPVTELQVGDVVRIQAGENIPADGIVQDGSSRINEALLTGESKPVEKSEGDHVIGGSTNGEGTLRIEVTETGDKSFLSQVQTLITQAQGQGSRAEDLAQKVAGGLFYVAVIVAIAAFIIWLMISDLSSAVTFAVTTLVIACPHALGLAIPLVVARSTSLGANRGLLVKDREALEIATRADVMLLDKTGTLTTGEFKVRGIEVLDHDYQTEEIVAILMGIEGGSSHPIAQSIVEYGEQQGISPKDFSSTKVISGEGVEGVLDGQTYRLVSLKAYGKELDLEANEGMTQSVLVLDETAIGVVSLGDELKEASIELMRELKRLDIRPIMATGDNERAAKQVADGLKIEFYADQSPQDKYDLVAELKSQDKTVIMVGDGINDAPSLALADVGIAIGAGTQVALDSADIVLTQSDPADIASFIELANKTTRKMRENLVWGAGYNFIAIPLAAGILAPIGFILSPAVGAILMSLSTVIVAVNAMTLRLDHKIKASQDMKETMS